MSASGGETGGGLIYRKRFQIILVGADGLKNYLKIRMRVTDVPSAPPPRDNRRPRQQTERHAQHQAEQAARHALLPAHALPVRPCAPPRAHRARRCRRVAGAVLWRSALARGWRSMPLAEHARRALRRALRRPRCARHVAAHAPLATHAAAGTTWRRARRRRCTRASPILSASTWGPTARPRSRRA